MEAVSRVVQGSYETDAVVDYVEEAKEAAFKDEKLRVACILQPSDTFAIRAKGARIKVLAPQAYSGITTLDNSHYMFTDATSDDEHMTGCAGLFSSLLRTRKFLAGVFLAEFSAPLVHTSKGS